MLYSALMRSDSLASAGLSLRGRSACLSLSEMEIERSLRQGMGSGQQLGDWLGLGTRAFETAGGSRHGMPRPGMPEQASC